MTVPETSVRRRSRPHAEAERVVVAAACLRAGAAAPYTTGVRPNSEPQTTMGSSDRPRDFRFLMTAAKG